MAPYLNKQQWCQTVSLEYPPFHINLSQIFTICRQRQSSLLYILLQKRSQIFSYSKHLLALIYPAMWNKVTCFSVIYPCHGQIGVFSCNPLKPSYQSIVDPLFHDFLFCILFVLLEEFFLVQGNCTFPQLSLLLKVSTLMGGM